MRHFHRTNLPPEAVMELAARFFGERLAAGAAGPRRREYSGAMGALTVTAEPEGGHYTLVRIATNQVGESEIDKLGRRFLTMVHTAADPTHRPIGAY